MSDLHEKFNVVKNDVRELIERPATTFIRERARRRRRSRVGLVSAGVTMAAGGALVLAMTSWSQSPESAGLPFATDSAESTEVPESAETSAGEPSKSPTPGESSGVAAGDIPESLWMTDDSLDAMPVGSWSIDFPFEYGEIPATPLCVKRALRDEANEGSIWSQNALYQASAAQVEVVTLHLTCTGVQDRLLFCEVRGACACVLGH
jgi:hypothetical protein